MARTFDNQVEFIKNIQYLVDNYLNMKYYKCVCYLHLDADTNENDKIYVYCTADFYITVNKGEIAYTLSQLSEKNQNLTPKLNDRDFINFLININNCVNNNVTGKDSFPSVTIILYGENNGETDKKENEIHINKNGDDSKSINVPNYKKWKKTYLKRNELITTIDSISFYKEKLKEAEDIEDIYLKAREKDRYNQLISSLTIVKNELEKEIAIEEG